MATYMSEKTDPKVYSILEHARITDKRVRVWYGDPETGKVWLEEYDVLGNVGRSTGEKPVFILIANSRSWGGGAMLTDNILRITIDKKEVYKHPNMEQMNFIIEEIPHGSMSLQNLGYTHSVKYKDRGEVANFKSLEKAERWVGFMMGIRNSK